MRWSSSVVWVLWCLGWSVEGSRLIFFQPPNLNLSTSLLVNPTVPPTAGEAVVEVFRLGNTVTNAAWDVGQFTGTSIPQQNRTEHQRDFHNGNSTVGAGTARTAVQSWGGGLGFFIDTNAYITLPLGTIVIAYDPPGLGVRPWGGGTGSRVHVKLCMACPYATGGGEDGHAVYSSVTVGMTVRPDAPTPPSFVWYSTALFDFNRKMYDALFMDTISGCPIVQGVASGHSIYNTLDPGSAVASSNTWEDVRCFGFSYGTDEFIGSISAINKRFNLTLNTNLMYWFVSHINVELEGTPGISGAMRVYNLTLEVL